MAGNRSWDVTTGPGITALGLAAARTVESSRPDALIDDPFGAAFIQAVESPVAFPARWPEPGAEVSDRDALHLHGSRYIGVRSRFYDDVVLDAVGGGVRQVVLLAAGLDTRAFRLGWPPGVTVYELDQPQVVAFKDDVLGHVGAQAGCARVPVGADLREDWPAALTGAGFDAGAPAVWVAEGLLAYLPAEAEELLLRRVDEHSVPGSRLALDHIVQVDRLAADRAPLDELSERSGVQMRSLINTERRRDPAEHLGAAGWSVGEEPAAAVAARYGRDLSDPFGRQATPPWLDTRFLSAVLDRR
ncbi:SAM-dependent methyltransferase [Dactylosporangium sp. NBC_01737]|uniref:SAM-dependent methyltransferase n=1 Tax=Dactylosporangium sp. NBC_01737 TaxID=2975959 RepID=UPI002E16012E|nr:SAM-dependent methyltransferase [Dactylosporangium sp. NBC_01737]